MKEKIIKIHSELNDGRITVSQATEQVLDLLAVIDSFDIDGSELSNKDQIDLQRLFWDGKVKIKIVL
jgi:hypothetical protein